jgi:vacuolar protein sorting-associated protein 72
MSNRSLSDDSDSDNESSSDEAVTNVESLVAGRQKRSTAGNRLSTLITREAEDDELELLFAEEGEDVEFDADNAEDQSDVQLDSSSDEEDAAGGDADDLEGERELQRQAKAARLATKRKAQDPLSQLPAFQKRQKMKQKKTVTVEDSSEIEKKNMIRKSEKSWAPSAMEGPMRQSSRTLSIQNKVKVYARLEASEKQRLHTLALMDAAAKKKDSRKTKIMTQEERLAEAAKTETINSKSLNRWEEAEKARQAERDARLAALHNRHMQGPFIRYWSGPAEWVNGKLGLVGRKAIAIVGGKDEDQDGAEKAEETSKESEVPEEAPNPVEAVSDEAKDGEVAANEKKSEEPVLQSEAPVESTDTEIPMEVEKPEEEPPVESPEVVLPDPFEEIPLEPKEETLPPPNSENEVVQDPSTDMPEEEPKEIPQASIEAEAVESVPEAPQVLVREISARNLIVLENFNHQLVKEKEVQKQILFKRKSVKPHRKSIVI